MIALESVLAKLQGVKPMRNGWMACCPAHADSSPSLHITPGVSLIMLHCFAGCSFEAICEALHEEPRAFFFDEELAQSPAWKDKARRQRRIDAQRQADAVIQAATHLEIEHYRPPQIDQMMEWVFDARTILLQEEWEKLTCLQYEEEILATLARHTRTGSDFPGSLE